MRGAEPCTYSAKVLPGLAPKSGVPEKSGLPVVCISAQAPYPALLHFDPMVTGGVVWVGSGRQLSAVCGQSEWIAVTPRADLVECGKCRDSIAKG